MAQTLRWKEITEEETLFSENSEMVKETHVQCHYCNKIFREAEFNFHVKYEEGLEW